MEAIYCSRSAMRKKWMFTGWKNNFEVFRGKGRVLLAAPAHADEFRSKKAGFCEQRRFVTVQSVAMKIFQTKIRRGAALPGELPKCEFNG
jgi:hypothetical protein